MTEEVQQQTIGHRLQEARENKKLTQESAATQLNLTLQSIVALESDDFDSMPPPMFTRGYLRAYARLLGLDGDKLIEDYNQLAPPEPELSSAYQTVKETESNHPIIRWATILIIIVITTLIMFWWYGPRYEGLSIIGSQSQHDVDDEIDVQQPQNLPEIIEEEVDQVEEDTDQLIIDNTGLENSETSVAIVEVIATVSASESIPETAVEPEPELEVQQIEINDAANDAFIESTVVQANQETTQQATSAQATASASESANGQLAQEQLVAANTLSDGIADENDTQQIVEVSQSALTASTGQLEPQPSISDNDVEAPPVGDDVMVIQTETESWIDVVDANGARLMYGMLRGESRRLQGTAPFQVFLGNTPGISIEMNGKTMPSPDYNEINNISRFSINADGNYQR